jgi:hypothetical protein
MNEREYNELQELSWRRRLTTAEQTELQRYRAEHPEAKAAWEAEAALTRMLGHLPDVPLASNFTAQVLQAVEREVGATHDPSVLDILAVWIRRLGPRLAWSSGLIAVALLVWQQHGATQRERVVAGAASVLQATALPGPEMLQDFDAIHQLSQLPPPTDLELLSALSQ